jgi:hypothetical protein
MCHNCARSIPLTPGLVLENQRIECLRETIELRFFPAQPPQVQNSRERRTKEEQSGELAVRGVSVFRRRYEAESRSHIHQDGEGIGFHLSHHVASVCLHRNFADAELGTDLLIQ